MARDLVFGNGTFLVNLDNHLNIRDIYYPFVGQLNHVAGYRCRIGVWTSDIGFACSMMWEGKKSTAQRVFYGAMDQIAKKTNDDALKVFKKALENVKPLLEVKTRRVGGANYQVPVEVNPFRRQSLAIRWLLQYSRERAGKTMIDKLADELIDASNLRGGAIKKKDDVHRMAEANKAFAHYRW